jgi:hypothetical protein
MSARPMTGMEDHPDISELRARYERAAETMPAHVVDGLAFLSGLYLAISPWVVGFHRLSTLTVNNVLTGIAVAMLAIGLASAYGRTHGVGWVAPLIGLWTIIAPWAVSGNTATTSTIWNNVITGLAILVFGLAATMVGMMPKPKR